MNHQKIELNDNDWNIFNSKFVLENSFYSTKFTSEINIYDK